MDEQKFQEMLRSNPQLRIVGDTSQRRNTGITCNTTHTGGSVIQADEALRIEAEAMLESKLQSELRRIALGAGYLYYHTHNSRRSDEGFLDTVLLRAGLKGVLYLVECKRQSENPTEKQQQWIDTVKAFRRLADEFFGMNIVVDAFVWRPMDLLTGRIERVLTSSAWPPQPE